MNIVYKNELADMYLCGEMGTMKSMPIRNYISNISFEQV